MREPLVHSHVADVLPDDHPPAEANVHCDRCGGLLHTQSNDCMTTWIETGRGNYDVVCFVIAAGGFQAGDLLDPNDNRKEDEPHLWSSDGPGVESLGPEWGLS